MDLHVHTRASHDSLNDPDALLAAADAAGVDVLAVTDHDRLDAALRLAAAAPARVIPGCEVKTRDGHDLIGLFLAEPVPPRLPLREAAERIRAQGGVVYVPHPFDTRRSGAGPLLDGIADLVDAVEGFNARTYRPGLNAAGEAWARARGLPVGAGSDAHTLREIGRGVVETPPFAFAREPFLAALRAGRIAARTASSPAVSLYSTYAKLHKRLFG